MTVTQPQPQHNGMTRLAPGYAPSTHQSGQSLTIPDMAQRMMSLADVSRGVLKLGVDYGTIPGAGDKPTLLQPGAQKLAIFYGLTHEFVIDAQTEDWSGADHNGEPFFRYRVRCILYNEAGAYVGDSYGDVNSWETRYRYRWVARENVPPELDPDRLVKRASTAEEFDFAIEKAETAGKYGKPAAYWQAWRQAIQDGKATPFMKATRNGQSRAYRMSSEEYRIPNLDAPNLVNTLIKIAQKRCLGSSTPVIVKTSRGVSRGDLDMMWVLWKNGNETIYLPGIDGGWRQVTGMIQDTERVVFRIDLADGSYVRATAEHRFPTERGIQTVNDLKVGDRLLRTAIPIEEPEHGALSAIGYLIGLFIAEGNLDGVAVRYTLNSDRTDDFMRIAEVARMLGCTVNITEKVGHCFAVNVHGAPFYGLIKHFVAGNLAYGKHLSAYAWRQGREFLDQLLAGYLAGDGSYTEGKGRPFWRITFTGQNREFAHDLRTLCNMLGYRFSLKRGSARLKDVEYPTFTGWIKSPEVTYNQKCLTEIVQIKQEKRPATVYDIEVDGDHLFCLADGIQTHNSFVGAVMIATGASEFFTQDLEDYADQVGDVFNLSRSGRQAPDLGGDGQQGNDGQQGGNGQQSQGQQEHSQTEHEHKAIERERETNPGLGATQSPTGEAPQVTNWRAGEAAKLIPAIRQATGITSTPDLFAALEGAGTRINPTMPPAQIAAVLRGETPQGGQPAQEQQPDPKPEQQQFTAPQGEPTYYKARTTSIDDPMILHAQVLSLIPQQMQGGVSGKQKTTVALLVASALPDETQETQAEARHALAEFYFDKRATSELSKAEASALIDILTSEDGGLHPCAAQEIRNVIRFLAEEAQDVDDGPEA